METVIHLTKVLGLTLFCLVGVGCTVYAGFKQLNRRKQRRHPGGYL